jgi:probable addiction module antidote protein
MSVQATASTTRFAEIDSSFSSWAETSLHSPKTSPRPFDWLVTTKGKDMATSTRKKASKVKTTAYDVAEHLRTPEEMAAYLDAWLEEAPDDISGIARALGDIARAKGMSLVAKEAGLSRESLYRALSADGNPSFATVLKVAKALGVRLHAQVA